MAIILRTVAARLCQVLRKPGVDGDGGREGVSGSVFMAISPFVGSASFML